MGSNSSLIPRPRRTFQGRRTLCCIPCRTLITAVSLDCGYPASSIRERIYVGDAGYGILLHTGTPNSEGTLGGLVQEGRKIEQHCATHLNWGASAQMTQFAHNIVPRILMKSNILWELLAMGYLLIAETSCERFNQYLVGRLESVGRSPSLHGG